MRSNRFAPWVLLGCLLFVANCDKDKAVPTSGAVGHVVVVEGEVSAQRGSEEPRMVRVKDTVFADDTIVTGEEASIQILLTHNGALWELGAKAERRIDKGIAYRAKTKGAGVLAQREEIGTSAAGRGTTREAADSLGTVLREPVEEEEMAPMEDGFSQGAEEDTDRYAKEERKSAVTRDLKEKKADAKGLRIESSRRSSKRKKAPRRYDQAVPRPKPSPQPPSPSPSFSAASSAPVPETASADSDSDDSVAASEDDEASSDDAARELSAKPSPPATSSTVGSKRPASAPVQIAFVKSQAQKCHLAHGGKGRVTYETKANGRFTATGSHASLKPLITCLKAAIRSKGLPNKVAVKSSLRFE